MAEVKLWRLILDDRNPEGLEELIKGNGGIGSTLLFAHFSEHIFLPGETSYENFYVKATPLHCAVVRENVKLIAVLVRYGAPLLAPSESLVETEGKKSRHVGKTTHGDTALHAAARSGNDAVIACLLKLGADARVQNAAGHKPLDVAKKSCSKTALRAFIDPVWRGEEEKQMLKLEADKRKLTDLIVRYRTVIARLETELRELKEQEKEIQELRELVQHDKQFLTALRKSISATTRSPDVLQARKKKLEAELASYAPKCAPVRKPAARK